MNLIYNHNKVKKGGILDGNEHVNIEGAVQSPHQQAQEVEEARPTVARDVTVLVDHHHQATACVCTDSVSRGKRILKYANPTCHQIRKCPVQETDKTTRTAHSRSSESSASQHSKTYDQEESVRDPFWTHLRFPYRAVSYKSLYEKKATTGPTTRYKIDKITPTTQGDRVSRQHLISWQNAFLRYVRKLKTPPLYSRTDVTATKFPTKRTNETVGVASIVSFYLRYNERFLLTVPSDITSPHYSS